MPSQPTLHSASVALAGLPEGHGALVQREALGGSEASLREAMDLQLRSEQEQRANAELPIPSVVNERDWSPG